MVFGRKKDKRPVMVTRPTWLAFTNGLVCYDQIVMVQSDGPKLTFQLTNGKEFTVEMTLEEFKSFL